MVMQEWPVSQHKPKIAKICLEDIVICFLRQFLGKWEEGLLEEELKSCVK